MPVSNLQQALGLGSPMSPGQGIFTATAGAPTLVQDNSNLNVPINPAGASQILQQLRGLKGQLTAGQINSADFLQAATPLVKKAQTITETIARQGSKAANSINPIWQQIQSENFVKPDQGQWQATLPLTEQEYAALPPTSKPTADQINQGIVPTSSLPGNVGLQTQIGQTQQQQQQLAQGAIGQTQQQQGQTMQQLHDIFGKLGQQQLGQATQNLTTGPQGEQLREFYNRMGLLNSGAFEQGLANQFGNIEQGIQNQDLQAMAGQVGTNQAQIQDILNSAYGVNSQLGTAALGRQFSLQDFYNNSDLQRQLADMQNNQYMSALNQSQQNPWTQVGLGFASGAGQGLGAYLGKHA